MSASMSVSASYGAAKAHASASYSDDYSSNSASGSWTTVAAVTGIVATNVNGANNLTDYALNLAKTNMTSFYNTCGSNILSQYLGGVLISQTTNFTSTSQSDTQSFNAKM